MSPADRQPVAGADPSIPILIYIAQVQRWQGRLASSEANAAEALRIAEERQLPNGRVWALGNLAADMQLKGDWDKSIALAKEGIELADRYGIKAHGAQTTYWLGRGLVATGKVDAGLPLLR